MLFILSRIASSSKYFLLFYFILVVISCGELQPEVTTSNPTIITIQPLGAISREQQQFVYNHFKVIYPHIELKETIPLPATAYLVQRNRYRADSIINYLTRMTSENHITIGLTDKDISTTKGNVKDWGVMGLGFCPGKACIASSFRLSQKDKSMQFFKVAIHEFGHTQGLPHCAEKTCLMRDAEGGNPLNEEKQFCINCRKILEKKGWDLHQFIKVQVASSIILGSLQLSYSTSTLFLLV